MFEIRLGCLVWLDCSRKQNQGAQTHIRSALSVTSSGLSGPFAIQERLILCSCSCLTAKRVRRVTDNIRRANQSFKITSHSDYAQNRIMSTVLLRWKMFLYYESLEVSRTLIFYYHMFLLDFIWKKARFFRQIWKKKKKRPHVTQMLTSTVSALASTMCLLEDNTSLFLRISPLCYTIVLQGKQL